MSLEHDQFESSSSSSDIHTFKLSYKNSSKQTNPQPYTRIPNTKMTKYEVQVIAEPEYPIKNKDIPFIIDSDEEQQSPANKLRNKKEKSGDNSKPQAAQPNFFNPSADTFVYLTEDEVKKLNKMDPRKQQEFIKRGDKRKITFAGISGVAKSMIKFKKIHERQKIMNNNSSMLRADSI